METRYRPLRSRQAFTLVELVVAVVVIGLLAAIAVIGLEAVTTKSSDQSAVLSLTDAANYSQKLSRTDETPALHVNHLRTSVAELTPQAGDAQIFVWTDGPSDSYGDVSAAVTTDGAQGALAMRAPSGKCAFTQFDAQGDVSSWVESTPDGQCWAIVPLVASGGAVNYAPLPAWITPTTTVPAAPSGPVTVTAPNAEVVVTQPAACGGLGSMTYEATVDPVGSARNFQVKNLGDGTGGLAETYYIFGSGWGAGGVIHTYTSGQPGDTVTISLTDLPAGDYRIVTNGSQAVKNLYKVDFTITNCP